MERIVLLFCICFGLTFQSFGSQNSMYHASKNTESLSSYLLEFDNLGAFIENALTKERYYSTEASSQNTGEGILDSDIVGITFANGTFTYDGTAKSIAISGTLPAGTSVTYVNNAQTNAGVYTVTANIDGGADYNDLTLTATMTITKANITGVTFSNGTFVYNGTPQSIAIAGGLPQGASETYINNGQVNAGVYTVTTQITGGGNYNDLTLTATLTITKATITGVTLNNGTFNFDGTGKSLLIQGTLPPGVTVSYTGNNQTAPGTYTVTALLNGGTNYENLTLTATLIINCPAVDVLNICAGSTSASMDWEVNGGTSWEVAVETTNLATPNVANIVTVTQPSYEATNLTVDQVHYFYVRNVCSADSKSPWLKRSFTPRAANIIEAEPFCAGAEGIVFPNVSGAGNDIYGRVACLGTTPNPVWYFLKIETPGDLIFDIIQNTQFDADGNPIGNGMDVDYVAFGPFLDLEDACLNSALAPCPPGVNCPNNNNNPNAYPLDDLFLVDCSYSGNPIESLTIQNAQVGQIYAILITNFANQPGFIKLQQTNKGENGAGSTDCSFLYNIDLGEDLTIEGGNALCPGATHLLDTELDPADYFFQWTKEGENISGANGPSYLVTETGLYGLKITTINVEADVYNHPDPILIEYFDDIIFEHPVVDLVECTALNQGLFFNLSEAVEGVTFNDVEITYYGTEDDAIAKVDPIGNANNLYWLAANFSFKQIWVRFQSKQGDNLLPCFKLQSFEIKKIECEVELVPLSDLEVCASPIGAAPSFDLSVYTDVVYHGLPGYNITYHTALADASGVIAANPIPAGQLQNYPGVHNQEIWVRVSKIDDPTVFKYTSFKLKVRALPVINPNLTPLYACVTGAATTGSFDLSSKDNEVKQSVSGLIVEYYSTEQGALDGDSTLRIPSTSPYISGATTVYFRLYSPITGCFSVGSLELELSPLPELNPIGDVLFCDSSGYHDFRLDLIALDLLGAQGLTAVNYKFYRTLTNAEQQTNALTGNTYTNVVPWAEVIYIRVENKDSKCYVIKPIGLKVGKTPSIVAPSDFVSCDTNGTGVAFFDLTTKAEEILNGLDDTYYTVSYYTTMASAQTKNPQGLITTPTQYSNLTSNYVYVRVEDPVTGCFSVVSLKLVVKPLPSIPGVLTDYLLCDTSENDGISNFVLNTKKLEILANNTTLLVSFHETVLDAQGNVGALNESSYTNTTAFQQTIYVRLTDRDTDCYLVRPMNLIVNAYPEFSLGDQGEVSVCTDSNNSVGTFNLVQVAQANIVNQQQHTFGFYETLDHATQNINKIVSPATYTSVGVGSSSVWIRIENNTTGCVAIYEIILKVNRTPRIPASIPGLVVCDNFGDLFDEKAEIDLTVNQGIITQEVVGGNHVVTYHNTQINAQNGVQAITTPAAYHNTNANEVIWFRLTDSTTGCYTVGSFTIKVNTGLPLVQPTDLSVCSDLTLGQNKYSFDLTIRENEILGGLPVFGTSFSYYETQNDALSGSNAIIDTQSYINLTSVQNIWVVVENEHGCRSTTTMTLRVFATPVPDYNPPALEVCEDGFGTVVGTFNLENSIAAISMGDGNLDLKFYETEGDAIGDVNEIVARTNYPSASATIYVRVENKLSNLTPKCFVVVALELKVNEVPYINPLTPLTACLVNHPTFYEFNLKDKDVEILDGRASSDYIIKYYFNQTGAQDNIGALPYTYTNTVALAQVIWVRLENKVTGCFNIAPLQIRIEERVFAFDIPNPAPFCDDNDDPANPINDGYTRINLTQYSADIIGTQAVAAGDLKVDYYASIEDYNNGIIITTPGQFVNTSNPQTIVAVVRYRDVDFFCEDYITFDVTVNKRPEVLPIVGGYLCTDLATNKVTPVLIDSKLDSSLFEFIWLFNDEVIDGAKLPYYEAMEAGKYTVRTIDKATGCSSFNSADAIVTAIDPFTIIIEEEVGDRYEIVEQGSQTILIRVQEKAGKFPPGSYEYALNDGAYQDSNVFYGVEAGDHLIWVRDKITGACAVSKVVSIMNYPKYFTPNGDGFNDTWNVLGLKNQPGAKVYIFDRSGKLIKQLSPLGEGWDGTYGGRPMPSTDYWFSVEYVDFNGYGREFKGHFSLKR